MWLWIQALNFQESALWCQTEFRLKLGVRTSKTILHWSSNMFPPLGKHVSCYTSEPECRRHKKRARDRSDIRGMTLLCPAVVLSHASHIPFQTLVLGQGNNYNLKDRHARCDTLHNTKDHCRQWGAEIRLIVKQQRHSSELWLCHYIPKHNLVTKHRVITGSNYFWL